jgi:hypothetical protein
VGRKLKIVTVMLPGTSTMKWTIRIELTPDSLRQDRIIDVGPN